jgi:hypothetical protein
MIGKKIEVGPEHFGKKTVIVGKSGSGKSYTARVMIEEGLKHKVSFLIIDPQSAYENLEGFTYLHAKRQVKDAKKLGIVIAATAKNVVISTKGMTITEQQVFVKNLLEGYRTTHRKGIRTIVIDECHKFAPEYDKAICKEEIRGMSQENRSDGLGFIAVEQRTQRLDKTVLSQADLLIIHSLTAKRDLMAIEGYLDDPKTDLPKIKKLKVGNAYFHGFADAPVIDKVRAAETTHSGEAPKSLLTEDTEVFNRYLGKVTKGGQKMTNSDAVDTLVNVPNMHGFMDLVANGAKMSVGLGVSGFVGAFASRWQSPIPVVSTRTLASALTTVAVYTGYRKIDNPTAKDVLGYAAAGSAVHTAGSLVFDVLYAAKINVPNIISFALNTMTGVSPVSVEGNAAAETAGGGSADVNTAFA